MSIWVSQNVTLDNIIIQDHSKRSRDIKKRQYSIQVIFKGKLMLDSSFDFLSLEKDLRRKCEDLSDLFSTPIEGGPDDPDVNVQIYKSTSSANAPYTHGYNLNFRIYYQKPSDIPEKASDEVIEEVMMLLENGARDPQYKNRISPVQKHVFDQMKKMVQKMAQDLKGLGCSRIVESARDLSYEDLTALEFVNANGEEGFAVVTYKPRGFEVRTEGLPSPGIFEMNWMSQWDRFETLINKNPELKHVNLKNLYKQMSMTLKAKLIKLGHQHEDLKPHLREILNALED